MVLHNQLEKSKEETGSNICVGLDLAVHGSRRLNTLKKNEDKLDVISNLIDDLSQYCCSFKINRQYILDLSLSDIQQLNNRARERGRPVIIDHKISDIGSTNDQALYNFKLEGFDAFTASPFPGNVREICEQGHNHGLAVIVLVLMSNPEAEYMKKCQIDGIPMYRHFARLTNDHADGAVVGSTGHVKIEDLVAISEEIHDKVILSPGIGAQGGKMVDLIQIFGNDVIFNVSRGIVYARDPVQELKRLNNIARKLLG
ncbi:MAG: orotidine 5'-phosphate decarboxylase [Candidatus Hodarchaeales archaeon]